MPIGGKLCLPHRRCAKELDRAVVNFLVPPFGLLPVRSAVTIPRCISTLHREERWKQALRGHSLLRCFISGEVGRRLFQFETTVVAR
jgi:hypothetical protein